MTKKEIRTKLDWQMLTALEDAIRCDERHNDYCKRGYMESAKTIMQTASMFHVISDSEFDNINHTLCYSTLNY